MIYLDQKAEARCDDVGCEARAPVRLVLGLAGGFMFEAPDLPGWQMVLAARPGQPVQLRCPQHARKVATAGEQVANIPAKGRLA